MEARQRGDDVAVLLVQMLEGGILAEDIHALPLAEKTTRIGQFSNTSRAFPCQEDAHLLIDTDELFATGAEGLGGFNQEVQQRRMAHQAVDLIHRDDARLLVDQAVTADGGKHLRVGQRLQDRVAFQFVKAEHPRLNPVCLPPRDKSTLVAPLRNSRPGTDCRCRARRFHRPGLWRCVWSLPCHPDPTAHHRPHHRWEPVPA